MFAGYIINNTCFTYVSIMISPVVSSTNIGAVKLFFRLTSQNLNVKS